VVIINIFKFKIFKNIFLNKMPRKSCDKATRKQCHNRHSHCHWPHDRCEEKEKSKSQKRRKKSPQKRKKKKKRITRKQIIYILHNLDPRGGEKWFYIDEKRYKRMRKDDLLKELDRRRAEVGWRRDPTRWHSKRGLTMGEIIDRLHTLDEKRYKKMNYDELLNELHQR